MEKNNGKIVAVVALAIAVVALSVGFAAFSATLTIQSATATVEKNDEFSANINYTEGQTLKCVYTGTETEVEGTYNAGTASGKTWTGVNVPLTAGHKSVTCTAQITNASAYTAYLRQISIASALTCASAGTGDDAASNAAAVCATVSAQIKVGGATGTFTTTNSTAVDVTGSTSTIAANGTGTAELTIAYTSAIAADGDLSVTIPTISLLYKTA